MHVRVDCTYIMHKLCLKLRATQTPILAELQMFYHTYPIFVFAIDVSSFLNKALHCVPKAFLSCNMQGSLLIEKTKKDVVVYVNWCYLSLFTLALEQLHTDSWNDTQKRLCLCLH